MAENEYEGILARPGYNEKYKTDVSWDELRNSALMYRRIPMIVAGGDHSGTVDPTKAVGFVDQQIDEENKIIRGRYFFFKDKFQHIPAEIQRKLLKGEHISASLGYTPFQDIRKYDHIAIGVESPVFEDIGIHAESNFRYEETEGIGDAKEPQDSTAEPLGFSEKQIEQLKGLIADALKPPEPATPDDESASDAEPEQDNEPEEIEVQDEEEEQPASQPKPRVEPERKPIPKEQSKQETTPDGLFAVKKGTRIISSPIGKPKEKQ